MVAAHTRFARDGRLIVHRAHHRDDAVRTLGDSVTCARAMRRRRLKRKVTGSTYLKLYFYLECVVWFFLLWAPVILFRCCKLERFIYLMVVYCMSK